MVLSRALLTDGRPHAAHGGDTMYYLWVLAQQCVRDHSAPSSACAGAEEVGWLANGRAGTVSIMRCCRADESHLTGESGDVLKRPGGAALMLSGAKARCPAPVPVSTKPAPDAGLWQGFA